MSSRTYLVTAVALIAMASANFANAQAVRARTAPRQGLGNVRAPEVMKAAPSARATGETVRAWEQGSTLGKGMEAPKGEGKTVAPTGEGKTVAPKGATAPTTAPVVYRPPVAANDNGTGPGAAKQDKGTCSNQDQASALIAGTRFNYVSALQMVSAGQFAVNCTDVVSWGPQARENALEYVACNVRTGAKDVNAKAACLKEAYANDNNYDPNAIPESELQFRVQKLGEDCGVGSNRRAA
ncbi:MAG: hypothetical protein AB7G93_03080 [Bdellovibrionales bacterium]